MNAPTLAEALKRKDAVMRAFVRPDGTFVSIPAKPIKRLVLLDLLAGQFEIGCTYTEPEVNAVLRARHPDFATWRRYLVDEGFLERRQSRYWRCGGTVEERD